MELSPMRYKDFVWPHNPKTYEITYEKKIAVSKVPFGNYYMQNMGLSFRIMKGEGEFVGENAYSYFGQLANVFYKSGSGLLIHPVWQASDAYFVKLSLCQEPLQDYVRYTFEFWEDNKEPNQNDLSEYKYIYSDLNGNQFYYVLPGDTLWGISVKTGVPALTILTMNPHVKNPAGITEGTKLLIKKGGEI